MVKILLIIIIIIIFVMNYLEECLISNDPSKYFYIAQGMLTIDGVDDVEEMKLTDEAFDVLGFTQVCIEGFI
jgi:myosin heavy subunit